MKMITHHPSYVCKPVPSVILSMIRGKLEIGGNDDDDDDG